MELLPVDLERAIPEIGSTTDQVNRKTLVARYFDPKGRFAFYAAEGERRGKDYLFYGYLVSPLNSTLDHWGYVTLSALKVLNAPFRSKVELDLDFEPITFAELKLRGSFACYCED